MPAPVAPPSYETPDPYLRPVDGEVVPQAVWDETNGLDLATLWQKGSEPPPQTASYSDFGSLRSPSGV